VSIIASEGGGGGSDLPLVPEDVHSAVCDMVIDLGLQPGTELYPDPKQKIYLRWQIPDIQVVYEKDSKPATGPAVIGKFYTLSLHEKSNLRPDLENWRGRQFRPDELESFDVATVIGKPCMVQVQHHKNTKGDMRAKVTNIIKVPKTADPAKLTGVAIVYDKENSEQYEELPEWLQKIIDKQITPKDTTVADAVAAGFDDVNDGEDEPPF